MPKKIKKDVYEFGKGVVAEKLQSGGYKVIASKARVSRRRNPNKKKPNKSKKQRKSNNSKVVKNKLKRRRSHKKTFNNNTQSGGCSDNLKLTVRMLREFYEKKL